MYELTNFIADLEKRNPAQPEFVQATEEVIESIIDVVNGNPAYLGAKILDRITEPDRVIQFKVEWEDDNQEVQVNRGYRVQFNNALGPYKGGIRFHPSVTLGGLKFLAFEQIFKNSLTGLPLGGGKGGSDFNPKGKSDNEIMRFAKSFLTELQKYLGPDLDVPAGDIGVGAREIGFLYGQWKRLRGDHVGVFTGKNRNWGGSLIRPEATGFGAVYFLNEMIGSRGDILAGKTVGVSGFGNVSWGSVMKATELGARVITISGPDGYIHDEAGIDTEEKFNYLLTLRASNNDIVEPYAKKFGATFVAGKRPWEVPVDVAIPCAIQNELNGEDANTLLGNGVKYVVEASNMGCTPEAVAAFQKGGIPFAPGKAANAGGVAVSGLEMTQNSMKLSWTREEVDEKLQLIMKTIHASCLREGKKGSDGVDYVKGANIAGFRRVADTMIDMGY
ncbi:MAG: NADP-specific glutamate dehydrogenase [Spirochaetaceae bacterium]|nr:MAG: NADP-specific glutamate dehydrogenase [Spirochaetaceae bacterium]